MGARLSLRMTLIDSNLETYVVKLHTYLSLSLFISLSPYLSSLSLSLSLSPLSLSNIVLSLPNIVHETLYLTLTGREHTIVWVNTKHIIMLAVHRKHFVFLENL